MASQSNNYGTIQTPSTKRRQNGSSLPTMENGEAQKEEAQPLLTEADQTSDNELPTSAIASASGVRILDSGVPLPESDDDEGTGAGNHREGEHAISNCDTIIHLLKGNIGTGILAMPDAIKHSGLLLGNVGLVVLAVICVNCMHMLVHCAHDLQERINAPSLTYADVAEAAFKTAGPRLQKYAKAARITINIFLCITQLGFCCVYFVFVSQNLQKVFDHHFGPLDFHIYMAIILGPMLGLCSVRNLKYLSPFSMLANVLQLVGLGLIFFYLLAPPIPHTWERDPVKPPAEWPLYFGTAIYAFEGIGVVLPLENQMRYPQDMKGWNGVLNTSMVMVSCLYIAVGFFGYLKYGDDVGGSITLNLPVNEWLAQIIILMMSLAIFLSYGLQFYVPVRIVLPLISPRVPERYHKVLDYALRYTLVLFTFALAAAIPCLDLFISLVGAVSSSTLALLAPAVIDTVTYWPHMGRCKWRLIRNVFLFVIGFVGFLTGTFVSIQQIAIKLPTGQCTSG